MIAATQPRAPRPTRRHIDASFASRSKDVVIRGLSSRAIGIDRRAPTLAGFATRRRPGARNGLDHLFGRRPPTQQDREIRIRAVLRLQAPGSLPRELVKDAPRRDLR